MLYSVDSYVRLVFYNTFPLNFNFQVQFITVHCTANTKNAIKYALQKERLSTRPEKDLRATKKEKTMTIQKKKDRQLKRDIMIRLRQ